MRNAAASLFLLLVLLRADASFSQPALTGQIYYHSYSGYENWDSNIYRLDLATGTRVWLSENWPIDHEMNVHVSPDGTKLVFMGDDLGEPRDWDIYIWTIGSPSSPTNLTKGGGREEDPKFSPDGTRIVFKKDMDVWQMDLNGNIINNVTATPSVEESMPFPTTDGASILFASGYGAGSDIYLIETDGSGRRVQVAVPDVQEYFPVTRDASSFFFTAWENSASRFDQIYLKHYESPSATRLLINTSDANYSDAYPLGSDYLVLSSSRGGGKGGYDLYIAEVNGTGLWSLDAYNASANSSSEDLGAVYHPGGAAPQQPPMVPASQEPYGGKHRSLPGTIEAEDYDLGGPSVAYSDSTAGNSGGVYRNDDVDLESTTDSGGGYNVGRISAGEWLEYTVDVPSGSYRMEARVASAADGGRFHLELDGTTVTDSIAVGNTSGWQNWQTVSATTSSITGGRKVLRLVADAGDFNINWLTFVSTGGQSQAPHGEVSKPEPGTTSAEGGGGDTSPEHDVSTSPESAKVVCGAGAGAGLPPAIVIAILLDWSRRRRSSRR